MEKLYKRDNTKGTRVWWAEITGNSYRLYSGRLDGKTMASAPTVCYGKNQGKSNATTDKQQCKIEVEALYAKKLKRGYTKSLEEIDRVKASMIEPMLAQKFSEYKHRLIYPVFSQPKLDGIRCIANAHGLWSRKGERIKSCSHIESIVVPLCEEYEICLDGELYNHELHDDFNEIQSLVMRKHATEEHVKRVIDVVQYHVYDVVNAAKSFGTRFKSFAKVIYENNLTDTPVKLVAADWAEDMDDLNSHYEKYLEQGYEGQMVRLNTGYIHKRTHHLLKRKEFLDDEFTIVDVVEGNGNRRGMAGRMIFKTNKGVKFKAGLKGGIEVYKKMLKERDKLIGMKATVEYQNLTPDGRPRFPRVKCVIGWSK